MSASALNPFWEVVYGEECAWEELDSWNEKAIDKSFDL